MLKPYKMKLPPRPKRDPVLVNRLPEEGDVGDDPPLTGFWGAVQLGSAHQERLLRGLAKRGVSMTPEYEIPTPYSLPGQGKVVDIVAWDLHLLIEADGPFHKLESSQAQDAERDAIINNLMTPKGFQPIVRIDYTQLASQELADAVATQLA